MKRYFKVLLSITALFSLFTLTHAQQVLLKEQTEKLHNNTRTRPEEKVFLHFDKDYYVPGETIWFKSYITLGGDHIPSQQSGLLYVSFYNQQNKLIRQLNIRSENGFGQGHLNLPVNLSGNEVRVKAYTSWMRNFSEEFIFQKRLTLITEEPEEKEMMAVPEISFYPEGGELITGVTNRVAIKTNFDNESAPATLTDSNGTVITEVAVNEKGYGQFSFKPMPNTSYQLTIQNQQFPLPAAKEKGISLTLNSYSIPSHARLILRKQENDKTRKVRFMIHVRGTVHFVAETTFENNVSINDIPKNLLPEGVNHLTIFSEKGKPLAERLFYIEDKSGITLKAEATETATTRSKVKIQLNLTDLVKEQNLSGNVSLSATQRYSRLHRPDAENIKTYLLLNSDLRGQIENPGYYFNNPSPEKKQALDLVMMTHGWRRFDWESLLNQKTEEVRYEVEKGLNLSGQLRVQNSKRTIEGGTITYFNNQTSIPDIQSQVSGKNGKFSFENLTYYEGDKIMLKGVKTTKGLKRMTKGLVEIDIDSVDNDLAIDWQLSNKTRTYIAPEISEQVLETKRQQKRYDSIYRFDPDVRMVEGVTVAGQRQENQFEVSPIYGKGTKTLKMPDDPSTFANRDIFSYMAGRVAGVKIIPTLNPANSIVEIRGYPPVYLLNDIPSNLATIVYIPIQDIDRVEIFKGPDAIAVSGSNGAGGAIAVYTKTGYRLNRTLETEPGVYALTLAGFQAPREFFSPDYATRKPEHAKPDIRNLIHWQPSIQIDNSGQATVEFWTSDNAGVIDINIQGLTLTGKPVAKQLAVWVVEN